MSIIYNSAEPAERMDIPSVHTVPTLAMTVQQVAASLGVSVRTVYRWHSRGLIRTLPCTRSLIFPVREVERFINEQLPADGAGGDHPHPATGTDTPSAAPFPPEYSGPSTGVQP